MSLVPVVTPELGWAGPGAGAHNPARPGPARPGPTLVASWPSPHRPHYFWLLPHLTRVNPAWYSPSHYFFFFFLSFSFILLFSYCLLSYCLILLFSSSFILFSFSFLVACVIWLQKATLWYWLSTPFTTVAASQICSEINWIWFRYNLAPGFIEKTDYFGTILTIS